MKKYLPFIPGITIGVLLTISSVVYAAAPVTQVINGGTGSTTLTGILSGNGKNPIQTVKIGSNLTFSGGTLSATGGGGGSGSVSTSTNEVSGQVPFFTSNSATPALIGGDTNFIWDNTNKRLGIATGTPMATLSVVGNEAHYGNYYHFGNASPNAQCNTAEASNYCLELVGDDNTTGGVGFYVTNKNSGTSAYDCYILLNSLVGNATTNYAGNCLNGTNYNDNTFGTLNNIPNLYQVADSMGPVSIQSFAPTQAASYINFFAGSTTPGTGPAASGEGMRLTSIGLGIGSTSPNGLFSVGKPGTVSTTTLISDLNVGVNGVSNPAFRVVGNITNAVTGVQILPAASGAGVTLSAISSAANETLNVNSFGTGNLNLNANTTQIGIGNTQISFQVSNSNKGNITTTQTLFQQAASNSTASTQRFLFSAAADSSLTASTEAPDLYMNFGQTRQHATGALTLQRDIRFTGSTHSFVGASVLANAAAFSIDGPDNAGTNATISTSSALGFYGQAVTGTVSTTTNILSVANTGGTNNLSIYSVGRVFLAGTTAGAGSGSVCMNASGEVFFDSGAACIVSSLRFKNVDATITPQDSLDTLNKLSPVYFHYKKGYGDSGKNQWEGFGAEDVALVDQDLVQYDASGTPYSVLYENITAKLVGAVQALSQHQNTQDAEIAQLQAEVKQLQTSQQSYIGCHI